MYNPAQSNIQDLLFLMETLRNPEHGCAWDMKQAYKDIAPYTLEEAYEVLAAIETGDTESLKKELGDLLFQVVFYAQIAREEHKFDFSDVVSAIIEKMLFRHPHVFPDGTLASAGQGEGKTLADIGLSWDELKSQERRKNAIVDDVEPLQLDLFSHIPLALPAAERAQRIQRSVGKIGFDWPDLMLCFEKLKEEVLELEVEIQRYSANQRDDAQLAAIEEELGDVMFSAVNIARKAKLNAEQVLRQANQKFIKRFELLQHLMVQDGLLINDGEVNDLVQLEQYWQQAKLKIKDTG